MGSAAGALPAGLAGDPRIWRGRGGHGLATIATGHAGLDAVLPGGGWPLGTLCEVLVPYDGIGELSLLLPLLARLATEGRPVAVIGAPYLLYPPALAAAGVDWRQVHRIDTRTEATTLWAAEQCLQSGALGAVLCWTGAVADSALRRLQLAAAAGPALGFLFRPAHLAPQPSPAPLRLRLEPAPGFDPEADAETARPAQPARPQVRVLKCRGGLATAERIGFERVVSPWAARC